jgi:hypothetical protein
MKYSNNAQQERQTEKEQKVFNQKQVIKLSVDDIVWLVDDFIR